MRINYYRFPETVEAAIRAKEGCDILQAHCNLNLDCAHCSRHNGPIPECPNFIVDDADDILEGITLTAVKNLMKKYGGSGTICHYDRYGSLLETSPITLKGNNSQFKYNHHL